MFNVFLFLSGEGFRFLILSLNVLVVSDSGKLLANSSYKAAALKSRRCVFRDLGLITKVARARGSSDNYLSASRQRPE